MHDPRRAKILVVDDDSFIISLITEIFKNDYDVLSAMEGEMALRIAARQEPDVILLDVVMPEMDGFEVCRRLLMDPATRDIPVVFVTGHGDASTELKALDMGAADFITKPINPPVAMMRIGQLLRRIRMEQELRDSEARYRALFEKSSEGVLLHSLEGDIMDANQAVLEMFGYTIEEIQARHPSSLVHPEEGGLVAEDFEAIVRDAFKSAEHRCVRKDGTVFNAVIRGKLVGKDLIQGVLRDVTRERQQEQALIRAKELAEIASQAKSEFLANMSHEIRTPLHGVVGMLRLMEYSNLSEEQREWVSLAVTSADRLSRLLTDILEIAKIEAGRIKIEAVEFEVKRICDSVSDLFQCTARDKRVPLDIFVSHDIPPFLVGDETRLRQILFNLVGNALKFTDQGRVLLEMHPLGRPHEGIVRILFSISDTGAGIPDEKLNILFQPFVQVDGSITRKHQGAGLGLAIVRRITDLMGGNISIESSPGQGTTVHVVLPFTIPRPVPELALHVEKRVARTAFP